ncbi:MAG TPA: manganese/iron ABC transporter ATP-binding protein, partial [Burkholderiaceae bacterium]|nr:manganese/iron ABC transporter ATP-binding protein [Burkholderiaceae bacterium]
IFTQANLEVAFGGVLRHFTLNQTDERRAHAIGIVTDDERPLVFYGDRPTAREHLPDTDDKP